MDRGAWRATVQSQTPLTAKQQTRRLCEDCRKVNPINYGAVGEGLGMTCSIGNGGWDGRKHHQQAETQSEGGLGKY